jgi:hypothetical protein
MPAIKRDEDDLTKSKETLKVGEDPYLSVKDVTSNKISLLETMEKIDNKKRPAIPF